jgi:hypothetical protein
VLVRIQAPDVPAEMPKRNVLHLSLVIDRSGSMAGQPLADKEPIRRAIREISEGGCTNLHGGWLQGAGTLAPG